MRERPDGEILNRMSDESFETNLELVRQGIGAWNEGDLERVLSVLHPDIEFRPETDEGGRPMFPGLEPVYFGLDGYRSFWRDFYGVFERIEIEIQESLEKGDRIAFLSHFVGMVREGARAERRIAAAIRICDRLVWHYFNFATWEQALAAAELRD
jgi:ketosteroid isomerase-like protein